MFKGQSVSVWSSSYPAHCSYILAVTRQHARASGTSLAVKAAVRYSQLQQSCVSVDGRSIHEHSRVKTIGPTNVGCRRQLIAFKQVVNVLKHLQTIQRSINHSNLSINQKSRIIASCSSTGFYDWFRLLPTWRRQQHQYQRFSIQTTQQTATSQHTTQQGVRHAQPYISHICPDTPSWPIFTNFGTHVRLVDVIKILQSLIVIG